MAASSKSITLALQGGGAHGAFTWGVLDRVLEEPKLEIDAMSATSAGAMNAAVMKSGLMDGGRAGAQQALSRFWLAIAESAYGPETPLSRWMEQHAPPNAALAGMIGANPAVMAGEALQRAFSPYTLNPTNTNPLRKFLEDEIEFDAVCRNCAPHLFVSATNVRTGQIRIFDYEDITTEALLASACLPTVFQAVEIFDRATGRDESYWDGGFTGNPALYPLIRHPASRDILIVFINPLARPETPKTAPDIMNRLNEISFNTSLLRELREIWRDRRLGQTGTVEAQAILHQISDDQTMLDLNAATKLTPYRPILTRLRDAGRAQADRFLTEHWGRLGEGDTFDLNALFT